jgi:hypothetical protein
MGDKETDKYGRPLLNCKVQEGGRSTDVVVTLLLRGVGIRYVKDVKDRNDGRDNFKLGCTLHPIMWRATKEPWRMQFESAADSAQLVDLELIGQCSGIPTGKAA